MEQIFTDMIPEPTTSRRDLFWRMIDCSELQRGVLVLDRGFYLILVVSGTASLHDGRQSRWLQRDDLLVLTPSLIGRISDASTDFRLSSLYIYPDYFDTLTDGQPMYCQMSGFISNRTVAVFHLDEPHARYMQQSFELFTSRMRDFPHYRDGIVRHLCSFVLLQTTDILCGKARSGPACIRRSNELFMNFRKQLVRHYQTHHELSFYARQLNISTTYLSRIVKRMTGHTVRYHLSELLRVEALRLLKNTDLGIKEIADRLGFTDQSVFGKFFMRETGMSPLKYRMKRISGGSVENR